MTASRMSDLPPVGPGTIAALIAFLATLPPEAELTDWTATIDGGRWARLTLTLLCPLSDPERSTP